MGSTGEVAAEVQRPAGGQGKAGVRLRTGSTSPCGELGRRVAVCLVAGAMLLTTTGVTRMRARWALLGRRREAGMATAEYAIVTLAAVAFAGLLLAILRGGEVREMLLGLIRDALSR